MPTAPGPDESAFRELDRAWALVLAAAGQAARAARGGADLALAPTGRGDVRPVPEGSPDAALVWKPADGWTLALGRDDPRAALIDLYLPICSATPARPLVFGHLGQSLDGFIATSSGESQWITGPANLLHMHRLRALSDAVVVGAGTVAADDPQLTTRLVPGPNPLRVVLDPGRRLDARFRVFQDEAAPTWYVCDRSRQRPGERRLGCAEIVPIGTDSAELDLSELLARLHERGCARVFVEGGGVTISRFLDGGHLDRLHLTIAPMLMGGGRPALRFGAAPSLSACARPESRVFRMGQDLLFDCDLRSTAGAGGDGREGSTALSRVR